MKYLAIAGVVLLLLLGIWISFGSKLVPNWSPETGSYGVKRQGQGLSSTQGPGGKQSGTRQAEDGDESNEAQGSKFQKLLEDLSVDAPGLIVPWRRNLSTYNVMVRFRIGWHAVTSDELSDNLWIPGIVETATQTTYVPIEYTLPYSFLTYDRAKYLILISSHVDTAMNDVDPKLVIWDRVNKRLLPALDGNILHYRGEGLSNDLIFETMKSTLVGREFREMPRGTHRTPLYLEDSRYSYRRQAGRTAGVSFGETRKHLLTIPVMTQPQMLN